MHHRGSGLRELSAGHEVACHFAEEVDGSVEQLQAVGRARSPPARAGAGTVDPSLRVAVAAATPEPDRSDPGLPAARDRGPRTPPRRRPPRLGPCSPLRIALAQLAPRLGVLDENLARHHELLAEARAAGAGLVVFPELGLTGYLLQDLAAEVAMRLDDPRLAALAAATDGPLGRSSRSSRSRPTTGCSSPPP